MTVITTDCEYCGAKPGADHHPECPLVTGAQTEVVEDAKDEIAQAPPDLRTLQLGDRVAQVAVRFDEENARFHAVFAKGLEATGESETEALENLRGVILEEAARRSMKAEASGEEQEPMLDGTTDAVAEAETTEEDADRAFYAVVEESGGLTGAAGRIVEVDGRSARVVYADGGKLKPEYLIDVPLDELARTLFRKQQQIDEQKDVVKRQQKIFSGLQKEEKKIVDEIKRRGKDMSHLQLGLGEYDER